MVGRTVRGCLVGAGVVLCVLLAAAPLLEVEGAKARRSRRSRRRGSGSGVKTVAEANKFKCDTCNRVVDEFFQGLEQTAGSIEFRGASKGWTKDNEKFLGKYAMSEARMTVALDDVCKNDYKCNEVFTDLEEDIEEWWMSERPSEERNPETLKAWLCIEQHKLCCPKGTFGKKCKPCAGGADIPCSGHGTCKGDGYRHGSGKCKCTDKFIGETCGECAKGFYEKRTSDDDVTCEPCDKACAFTCTGPGPGNCNYCKKGFDKIDGECRDVDECSNEDTCKDERGTFCRNTIGSFECEECDAACLGGCTGEGPEACLACLNGYDTLPGGGCRDIDECADDPCTEGQVCINTPGSFRCETCHESCDQDKGCTDSGADKCIACASGFFENDNGECEDVDDCKDFPCEADKTCNNQPGSFSCSCTPPAFETEDDACRLPSWSSFPTSAVTVSQEEVDTSDLEPNTFVTANMSVGSSAGNMRAMNVTFPTSVEFTTAPAVHGIRPVNECCGDQFEFQVANVTPQGFSCLIKRVDSQASWGQELVAEYTAVASENEEGAPAKDEL